MPESTFDLPGSLRRIRRVADLSQRELARAAGLSAAAVAHAELGSRDLRVGQLVQAAACARLRLALLDVDGVEVLAMADDTVRDMGGRHFPAHLDTCLAEDRPSRLEERSDRRRPTYTFDRDRAFRDRERAANGLPADHRRPQADDDPAVRRARRDRERELARREERQRRFLSAQLPPPVPFVCECLPGCDAAREDVREVHVGDCPCRCDIA
jgi:HTH-type transcriptional regulator/antitoxin HipB